MDIIGRTLARGGSYADVLRLLVGLSQRPFAELIRASGIPRQTAYFYYQGRLVPPADRVWAMNKILAEWLEVEPLELWLQTFAWVEDGKAASSLPNIQSMLRLGRLFAKHLGHKVKEDELKEIVGKIAAGTKRVKVKGKSPSPQVAKAA